MTAIPDDILEKARGNERDIYEVANQLEGYVGPGTPDHLAKFLLREGKAACDLADQIVRLRARVADLEKALEPFAKAGELFPDPQPEFDQCIYNPAAGDEYSLGGSHLRAARDALAKEAKE